MSTLIVRKLFPLILLASLLVGCSQPFATATPTSTATLTPTETATPLAVTGAQDIVLLSMEENGYAHLFFYIPQQMPLTRLTYGEWDDPSPALSPDGTR